MPPLPAGTMIVYVHHLYFGLAGAATLGFILGILFVFWYQERERTIKLRRDGRIKVLGRQR